MNIQTRREFIQQGSNVLSVLSVVGMTGCVCGQPKGGSLTRSSCCFTPDLEPESLAIEEKLLRIHLSKAPSLQPIGSAAFISNEEKGLQIIVVHAGESDFYALSRYCTHGMQVLSYNANRERLQCNGFNHSIFDLDGEVVKGPAEKPLQSYPVTFANDQIEIRLA